MTLCYFIHFMKHAIKIALLIDQDCYTIENIHGISCNKSKVSNFLGFAVARLNRKFLSKCVFERTTSIIKLKGKELSLKYFWSWSFPSLTPQEIPARIMNDSLKVVH